MRTFACMLLLLGVAAAQEPAVTTAEAATAAEPAAAASAPAAAAAAPAAGTAAAAGGLANRGTIGLNLGPAFYGPGLNNPNALPPNSQVTGLIQNYLKTAPNAANLRVFVDIDGRTHFTDQFGQETEIVHPQFGDLTELFQDPIELHERMNEFRQQNLELAINRCQTDLRQRFLTNPASFTPDIFGGAAGGAGGAGAGAGGATGAGLAGARVVVA